MPECLVPTSFPKLVSSHFSCIYISCPTWSNEEYACPNMCWSKCRTWRWANFSLIYHLKRFLWHWQSTTTQFVELKVPMDDKRLDNFATSVLVMFSYPKNDNNWALLHPHGYPKIMFINIKSEPTWGQGWWDPKIWTRSWEGYIQLNILSQKITHSCV